MLASLATWSRQAGPCSLHSLLLYVRASMHMCCIPLLKFCSGTSARLRAPCAADIHTPGLTVYESLLFCAHLRINNPPDSKAVDHYVDEVCLPCPAECICSLHGG